MGILVTKIAKRKWSKEISLIVIPYRIRGRNPPHSLC
jgi:hypothetical protein